MEFDAQRKAQQAALERRSRNFLRALVVVFAVAAIVAVGLTIFAFNQQGIAQGNAATAVVEADARATQQIIAEQSCRPALRPKTRPKPWRKKPSWKNRSVQPSARRT
jgi:hypothetical protein